MSDNYKFRFKDESLSHHGILGQKWGVQNGPPYPLGSGDHSASEKKAGWRKSLSGDTDKQKPRAQFSKNQTIKNKSLKEKSVKSQSSTSKLSTSSSLKDSESEKLIDSKLAKKLVGITLGVAATAGLSYGIYAAYKYDAVHKISALYKSDALGSILKAIKENKSDSRIGEIKKIIKNAIDETDYVLKEGKVLHRISRVSDSELDDDFTYAAFQLKDRLMYKGYLKDRIGTGKTYDMTLKAMNELRAPSRKKAYDIFIEMLAKNPELLGRGFTKETILELEKVNPDLFKTRFDREVVRLPLKNEIGNAFINALRDKGYTALLDYHDIDDKLANKPLIVIDPNLHLSKIKERDIGGTEKLLTQIGVAHLNPETVASFSALAGGLFARSAVNKRIDELPDDYLFDEDDED